MQPYQEAEQESLRQAKSPVNTAGNLASMAIGAGTQGFAFGAGQKILAKIAPFLSEYIPAQTAMKGISKVNPKLGKFIKGAEKNGKAPDEIKEFLTEKLSEPLQAIQKTTQEKAYSNKQDVIEKLYKFAQAGKTQGNEFLKYANQLIKSQDIEDLDTFSNFYKWWNAKPSQKRGAPRAEFELFRQEIGNYLKQAGKKTLEEDVLNPPHSTPEAQPQQAQPQQQQSVSPGQQALMDAIIKLQQARGKP